MPRKQLKINVNNPEIYQSPAPHKNKKHYKSIDFGRRHSQYENNENPYNNNNQDHTHKIDLKMAKKSIVVSERQHRLKEKSQMMIKIHNKK